MTEPLTYEQISHRATRSAATIMLRGLAVRGIGFLGNVVLARVLLPRDFGMVALGMTIVNIGDFLASGGLASVLVREKGEIAVRSLQAIYALQLAVTIGLSVAATLIGVPLGETGAVTAIMVWALVLDTGRMPNAILLERRMEYKLVLQTEVAETFVWNAWAVAAVLAGAGVWGVATAQVARAAFGFTMLSLRGPTGFLRPRWDWSAVRPLLRFGMKFQAFSAITLVRDQGIGIVVAAVGGLAVIGVWGIVSRLTLVVGVLLESLWRVSFPAMSRLREAGTPPGPVVRRSISLTMTAVGLLVVPLGGTSPALIPVVFGHAWSQAIDVVPFAAGAVLISGPLGAVLVGYLLAHDRAGLLMKMAVVDCIVWLIVGLPLLLSSGVIALGAATLASACADALILTRALHRTWSIGVARPMMAPLLSAAGAGSAAWAVTSTLGANVGALIAGCAVGEIIYVGLLLILGREALSDSVRVVIRAQRGLAPAA